VKPKEARDRLFKHSKPNIRPIAIITEDGNFSKDMAVLWAAYQKGSFQHIGELSQEEFTDKVLEYLGNYHFAWVVEDKNYKFPSGYGAVGLIVGKFDGWALEPHWMPFSWATARNRLRTAVSFFQMARYEKGVGVLNIYSGEKDVDFFHNLKKRYGVVYYIGKFPRGDYGEDRYIFYARGKDFFKGRRLWAA
jgi:hypothetical protein